MHHRSVALATLLASLAGGANARASTDGAIVMQPLLAIKRESSPDRGFIVRATTLAASALLASDRIIATGHVASVQAEAVRAYNTSAAAYNALADIASERGFSVAVPQALFTPDRRQGALREDATLGSADVAFANDNEWSLREWLALYRREMRQGRDPGVVAFATAFAQRLEHDLALATLGRTALTPSTSFVPRARAARPSRSRTRSG